MITSGPSTANANPTQASQPRSQFWPADRRRAGREQQHAGAEEEDRAEPEGRVPPHQRRDRDRVGGPGGGTADRERVSRKARRHPSPRPDRDEHHARERDTGGEPEPPALPLHPGAAGEQAGPDRERPEEERGRRRRRQIERVDEAELVGEQDEDAAHREQSVAAPQPDGSLPHEGDPGEHERRHAVADGCVRERVEALVEDVLRDREVERPERHGRQQHQVGRRATHQDDATEPLLSLDRGRGGAPSDPTLDVCRSGSSSGSSSPALRAGRSAFPSPRTRTLRRPSRRLP